MRGVKGKRMAMDGPIPVPVIVPIAFFVFFRGATGCQIPPMPTVVPRVQVPAAPSPGATGFSGVMVGVLGGQSLGASYGQQPIVGGKENE